MKMRRIFSLLFILFSINSFAQTSINGLAHYWSFNGDVTDSQGSNNGVINGNPILTTGRDGSTNSAYYFDGDGDYISVSSPSHHTTPDVTIAFWIKPDGLVNDMRFLSSLDGGIHTFSMNYLNQQIKTWEPTREIASYPTGNHTEWTFICLTIKSNVTDLAEKEVTGYLNGASGFVQTVRFGWPTNLGIGSKFLRSYGKDFKGSMDDFMIFDRLLTAGEIQTLYTENSGNTDGSGGGSDGSGGDSGGGDNTDGSGGGDGVNDGGSGTSTCESIHCVDGKVGIGTTAPDTKLTVRGIVHAEEMKIDLNIPAPDYVFKSDYDLRSIQEVEAFIEKNSHLPEIPSAEEFAKNGVMQAEMDMHLLKKIEELTLYTIEQQKEIDRLKTIEERLNKLEKLLNSNE